MSTVKPLIGIAVALAAIGFGWYEFQQRTRADVGAQAAREESERLRTQLNANRKTAALSVQPRTSPHETISRVVDGNRITVIYGRPYSKDPETGAIRKIWGALVPYGKPWRTGADEATTFITQQTIVLGQTTLPAGAYTLFTQPESDGSAKLIVSRQLGQWGLQYDEKQDFARISMKRETLSPACDQFTIAIDKDDEGMTGFLQLMWESTKFIAPFTIKK